jgi:hypothetical protein
MTINTILHDRALWGKITFNKSMVFPISKLRELFLQMVGKKRADECAAVRKQRHSRVFGVGDLFAQKNLRWEIRTKGGGCCTCSIYISPGPGAVCTSKPLAFKEQDLGNYLGGGIRRKHTRWDRELVFWQTV